MQISIKFKIEEYNKLKAFCLYKGYEFVGEYIKKIVSKDSGVEFTNVRKIGRKVKETIDMRIPT